MSQTQFLKIFKPGIILFLLFIYQHVYSQELKEDVVYLKNGSVIRGQIMEYKSGEYVKIKTVCLNIWVFTEQEIEKIAKEDVSDHQYPPYLVKSVKEKGYVNISDFGILAGSGELTKDNAFSIHVVNGYKFPNKVTLGGGIGVEFFNETVIPLFGDFRYHFFKDNLSPFAFIQSGYAIPLEKRKDNYGTVYHSKGGPMFSSGIGYRFTINNRTAVALSIAYRFQELKTTSTFDWNEQEVDIFERYHRLAIRFGFYFY